MQDNPARPAVGVRLCAVADLADPGAKGFRFRAGDTLFAGFVVRMGDQAWGYVDSCPHAGWPLSVMDDRYLVRGGDKLLCAGHGALFRPQDGVCIVGPCEGDRLTPWPVRIVEGAVLTA